LAVAVAVAALLVAFTTWGLVGLALVAVALVGVWIVQDDPPVTKRGAAVLAGLGAWAAQLHSAPTTLAPERAMEDASRILPYAIVLGGWDRWLAALVAADQDKTPDPTDLAWYHAPDDWHLSELPESLAAFITIVTGRLFARA